MRLEEWMKSEQAQIFLSHFGKVLAVINLIFLVWDIHVGRYLGVPIDIIGMFLGYATWKLADVERFGEVKILHKKYTQDELWKKVGL